MIRLGRISYVNMAPVFHRLDADVEEVTGVPTDLNRRLVAGEIDLAPISSSSSARLSSVGTPTTSSTSASSRWKTGAMFT